MALTAKEIILNDGQLNFADLLIFNTKNFKGVQISYTVERAEDTEVGDIYLSFDQFTRTAKITTIAHFDNVGIIFCADVNEDQVRLLYSSTFINIRPVFKYNVIYFPL